MVELEEAQDRLAPLEKRFIQGHMAAEAQWEAFVKEHPDLALPFDTTTRANVLNNYICSQMARASEGLPNVEVTEVLQFFALKIDDDILLRFKFVGHGEPRNYPTPQQQLLSRQLFSEEMTMALTGDPALKPPTLLTCGYTLTLDGMKIGRIELRRNCNGHAPWFYDIYGGDRVVRPQTFDGRTDDTRPATIRKTTERKDADGAADHSESS